MPSYTFSPFFKYHKDARKGADKQTHKQTSKGKKKPKRDKLCFLFRFI